MVFMVSIYLLRLFCFVLFYQVHILGIWKFPGQGSNWSDNGQPTPQPQQRGIRAASETCSAAHGGHLLSLTCHMVCLGFSFDVHRNVSCIKLFFIYLFGFLRRKYMRLSLFQKYQAFGRKTPINQKMPLLVWLLPNFDVSLPIFLFS